jgi:hypothetical protein
MKLPPFTAIALGATALPTLSPATLNYPVGLRRHPFSEGELARAKKLAVREESARAHIKPFPHFSRVSDSPSVKGWTRSGRGSSALRGGAARGARNAETPRRLRRHPSSRGEFARAGEFAGAGEIADGGGFGGGVNNSPLVEGWTRSGRGVLALKEIQRKISNCKLQVNSKRQKLNSKLTLDYPGAPRHPFTEGELARAPVILSGAPQARSRRTGKARFIRLDASEPLRLGTPVLRLRRCAAPLRMTGGGVTVSGVGFRVSDSPSVKGWPRSGRGSSAFGADGGLPVAVPKTPATKTPSHEVL